MRFRLRYNPDKVQKYYVVEDKSFFDIVKE